MRTVECEVRRDDLGIWDISDRVSSINRYAASKTLEFKTQITIFNIRDSNVVTVMVFPLHRGTSCSIFCPYLT